MRLRTDCLLRTPRCTDEYMKQVMKTKRREKRGCGRKDKGSEISLESLIGKKVSNLQSFDTH